MFEQFMTDLIDETSFKILMTEEAMNTFASYPDVVFVQAPSLYRLYTLYLSNTGKKTIKIKRALFYRKVGSYLYYEKLMCTHGDEYYYYIRFNKDSDLYKTHNVLIKALLKQRAPLTLTDYIGTKDLSRYNVIIKD